MIDVKSLKTETLHNLTSVITEELNRRKREEQKEVEEKYYTFSGTWAWGCWATNEDEAWDKFRDSDIEDFDIDYGHAQVEIDD